MIYVLPMIIFNYQNKIFGKWYSRVILSVIGAHITDVSNIANEVVDSATASLPQHTEAVEQTTNATAPQNTPPAQPQQNTAPQHTAPKGTQTKKFFLQV